MNITRFNVMSGLYGTYVLRDDGEDVLRLPSGKREIPLLLADRNLDTDEDGRLGGRLLHKTVVVQQSNRETGRPVTIPFSGPCTTVNGRIRPLTVVDSSWYRFRPANASNARSFDLVLLDADGDPVPGIVHQIGSDGGLLPRPVPVDLGAELPTLTAAPAERDTFELPEVLSGSFRRLTHDLPHGHRLVVLTPPATKGAGGHSEIREMTEVTDPAGLMLPADGVIQLTGADGSTRTYRRIARTFNDGLGFTIGEGSYEQWSFLDLAPIVHPMHIHLADFQLLGRDAHDVSGFDPAAGGTRAPIRHDAGTAIPLAPNEQGYKDVFRVPGGQLLRVMGRFDGAHDGGHGGHMG